MAIDERTLIETVFAPLAAETPGAFGLRDDAALLAVKAGEDHVVTLDTLVGGVHFRHRDPAAAIGKKALRVNISDLNAKGARPFAWFLSLALPATTPQGWLRDFAAGLAEDQAAYGLALHGGDTVVSPQAIVISVTMVGRCPGGTSVRRFGARPGDLVYVSGTIGDSALGLLAGGPQGEAADGAGARPGSGGLASLEAAERQWLGARYLLPDPPVRLVEAIRQNARAAMDISDGLVSDLGIMCAESGVGAQIDVEAVPLSEATRRALAAQPSMLPDILAGGDDYELLAAIPPARAEAFETAASAAGAPVRRIGAFAGKAHEVRFLDAAGDTVNLPRTTFLHF